MTVRSFCRGALHYATGKYQTSARKRPAVTRGERGNQDLIVGTASGREDGHVELMLADVRR